MRKIITLVAALCFVSGLAFAGGSAVLNLDNTAGPITDSSAKIVGNIFPLYGGITGGVAIGGAAASLDAKGKTAQGITSIKGSELAYGAADSNSFKSGGGFFNPNATIGTEASAAGAVASHLEVGALGLTLSTGSFTGITGEATAAGAGIANAPFWNATQGHTDVQGAQAGAGGYIGGAGAFLIGKSTVDASLAIEGQSNVISARNGSFVPGGITEGFSSAGAVGTEVKSDVTVKNLGLATGGVIGGWTAGGGLSMDASQSGNFQPATASANAAGIYNGSGALGQNYSGSAVGGVATQITQTGNSALSSSSGGMVVKSVVKN
jgi:hypothetical protein